LQLVLITYEFSSCLMKIVEVRASWPQTFTHNILYFKLKFFVHHHHCYDFYLNDLWTPQPRVTLCSIFLMFDIYSGWIGWPLHLTIINQLLLWLLRMNRSYGTKHKLLIKPLVYFGFLCTSYMSYPSWSLEVLNLSVLA